MGSIQTIFIGFLQVDKLKNERLDARIRLHILLRKNGNGWTHCLAYVLEGFLQRHKPFPKPCVLGLNKGIRPSKEGTVLSYSTVLYCTVLLETIVLQRFPGWLKDS